jgi:hypothetical protein
MASTYEARLFDGVGGAEYRRMRGESLPELTAALGVFLRDPGARLDRYGELTASFWRIEDDGTEHRATRAALRTPGALNDTESLTRARAANPRRLDD